MTTAPNPATNRIHKTLNKISINNQREDVLEIRSAGAIPMSAAISQSMKETQYYNATPRSRDVARNPAVAAAATTYTGVNKFFAPCPGDVFRAEVELAQIKTQIPGITAVDADVSAVWVFDEMSDGNAERYKIVGDLVNGTSKSYRGVSRAAIYLPNALQGASGVKSLVLGDSIGASQMGVMQDDFADQLRGLLADGSDADTNVKTIKDPATNANSFGIMGDKLQAPGQVAVNAKTAQNLGFFLMYDRGVQTDE
jgi:hypothetical protein